MISPSGFDERLAVTVDWRFSECAKACRQIQRHRVTARWWRPLVRTVLVALGALLALALVGGAIKGNLPQLLPSIAVVLLFLALAGGGASWLTAWQFRRNNPNVVSGFHYDLSAAGFRTQCGSVDSTVAWPGLMRIVETGDFFLAYLARNAAHYIPKRVLTDNDMRTVRRLLREHVPDKIVLAV
jgi:hypothetical protein